MSQKGEELRGQVGGARVVSRGGDLGLTRAHFEWKAGTCLLSSNLAFGLSYSI